MIAGQDEEAAHRRRQVSSGRTTPPRSAFEEISTRAGDAERVYRLRHELGFAIGAIVAALIADAAGIVFAIWGVAAITAACGVVFIRMRE